MSGIVRQSLDRLLGRGDAAITVPPMDGPLKPNRAIEDAEVVAQFAAPSDLAWDGSHLWVADGKRLLRREASGDWTQQAAYERPITALAHSPSRGLLAAVGGEEIVALANSHWMPGPRVVAGQPLSCINGLCAMDDGTVIATQGSAQFPGEQWAHDLLSLGRSGRVCRLTPDTVGDEELQGGLRHPFGALPVGSSLWVSESWGHRVIGLADGHPAVVADRLPAYPSRLAPAAGGGAWLTLFAPRTRLVEFVLREPEYRRRMMQEVDPRYWVAPALSSGTSFLEPLQGGSVKQLGIMKPWAPPRSYGLVVRLDAQGLPVASFHSRADGGHHGIVAACEAGGHLYLLSRGAGRLLRIALEAA